MIKEFDFPQTQHFFGVYLSFRQTEKSNKNNNKNTNT